jgi:hypothetical protein
MTDEWSSEPLKSAVWDRKLADNDSARCTAHRSKNGARCRKFAIAGSTVCRTHGGAAKQVRNAARARLQNASDRMARELLRMASDDNVSDAVKLKAITEALDRGGLSAKTEVEITARPYETIMDGLAEIQSGSRAEYRRSQGLLDTPTALAVDANAPIDAEVFDAEPDGGEFAARIASGERFVDTQGESWPGGEHATGEPLGDDLGPVNPFGGPLGPTGPAAAGMMTLEDAVAAQAEIRRAAARMPAQRALPPGRST